MAWITFSSRASPTQYMKPDVQIYIGGQLRDDAVPLNLSLRSGFEPSSLQLRFETSIFPRRPLQQGSRVEVYINRALNNYPVFKGYVSTYGSTYQHGDVVDVECLDARGRLNDDVCVCNYNELDRTTGLPRENLTSRQVITDIVTRYQTWQSANGNAAYLIEHAGAFPLFTRKELNFLGIPHGTAIEELMRLTSDSKPRRAFLKYIPYATHDMLSAFEIGSGPLQYIAFATQTGVSPGDQPYGYPMADRIEWYESDNDVRTRIKARGAKVKTQATFTLEEAWATSLYNNVCLDWDKYTNPVTSDGDPNPNYLPHAQYVGRLFAIPRVSQTNQRTGASENVTPLILQELLDESPETAGKAASPFCIVSWAGWPDMILRGGFQIIDNKHVLFDDPIVWYRWVNGVEETVAPSSIKLVCAYTTEDRLELSADEEGEYTHYRNRRELVVDDAIVKHCRAAHSHRLESDGSVSSVVSAEDIVSENALLSARARARLAEMSRQRVSCRVGFPYIPLHLKLGDSIALNGERIVDSAITEIDYDLQSFRTLITVASQ